MSVENDDQTLPRTGARREELREKGQFWTPPWVAEAMVAYAVAGGAETVFDPAVGAGAFFRAAKALSLERNRPLRLAGVEKDPMALNQGLATGLSEADLESVRVADFVSLTFERRYAAIVANPPYIRHHRLESESKARLRDFAKNLIGVKLDGRAGLHIYFLLRALELLEPLGRLAFIIPADSCEGVFAPSLWRWIANRYRLDAVVTFTGEASPFPNVDTNPLIVLIQNCAPQASFRWVQCRKAETKLLKDWLSNDLGDLYTDDLYVSKRDLEEGLATGLSRPPLEAVEGGARLCDFAHVLRGIATGANDFFFLTRERAARAGLAPQFLARAVGRTRDVPGTEITEETLSDLDERGRPTLLFAPDGRAVDQFPANVRRYIEEGERTGISRRALIAQRRPWYKMERRRVPPILFAYLGRRSSRFILNRARSLPLTGFLCVYPNREDQRFIESLFCALNDPETLARLPLVGKSYGNGAIKVEPRALERLPLPESVLTRFKLK